MVTLAQSSGDLLADRRFAIAQELLGRGELEAAADLLVQTIETAPRFALAWFRLGELRLRLAQTDEAVAAFQQVCALDPEDHLGAGLHLVRLGALPSGDMPAAYVRTLFDQYAPRFEASLSGTLAYRGPALLRDALATACAREQHAMCFGDMLDLGCGTGLTGVALRPFVERLVGVDLSAGMVAAAHEKRIYDRLETGDLIAFLHAEAREQRAYSLILAADVFPYLAWLPPVLGAAAKALAPGGLIGFTVETHAGDDVILGEKLRYAHGAAHVRGALAGAGLSLIVLDDAWTRSESGVPAPGLVAVARRALTPWPRRVGSAPH
jgi:predicted TPR repeat methyltransferase